MKVTFDVLVSPGKSVGRLEVDEEGLRLVESSNLFENVLEVPLKKGLQRRVPIVAEGGAIVDGVETVKKFNLRNLGLLEEYLFKLGLSLKEIK